MKHKGTSIKHSEGVSDPLTADGEIIAKDPWGMFLVLFFYFFICINVHYIIENDRDIFILNLIS
jgi:hypothetical protein